MRYACIRRHEVGVYAVALMCRVLKVSRSGYYAWRNRDESARVVKDHEIAIDILAAYEKSRGSYGSPRVHEELKANGVRCGRKRVARIMRKNGIRARTKRSFRVTTNSNHAYPIAPNILNREFSPSAIGRPNRVWVGDITYIPTREGWLFLAVLLDLFSRRVVGWSMSYRMERRLTLDALSAALGNRSPRRGIVGHTDRGSQYASGDYQERLKECGMICSMSRKGDCWDNAVAESFFATLKRELVDLCDWKTRDEARAAIFEYIEVWYNRERRHSSIGYMSPVNYELEMEKKGKAA